MTTEELIENLEYAGSDKYYYRELWDACISEIKKRAWTPCVNNLPEFEKEVLVCLRWGTITIAQLDDDEGNHWIAEEGIYNFDDVAAWMELPEKYKEI